MTLSEQSAAKLRALGYRLTPQRLVILDVLINCKAHMTPSEIYFLARQKLPGLTEATVYRTLIFLVEQGLALVAHMGSGQLVYEYAERNHHHLICKDCHEMWEIEHEALQVLYNQFKTNTGFHVDSSHLTFFGHCPDCFKES